ncbi:hypothetical protein [Sediminicola luteus]|uniref:Uncharacterized protein n=1 Tax=Sediminicola luteus TaxID=319238 RepID=A0A2A4G4R8_9FLAO|nr:hypothetical protein [Sediminicola luteus]PCE62978.1 hypothetical protein B7P33_17025 [Sediminicola luteus]
MKTYISLFLTLFCAGILILSCSSDDGAKDAPPGSGQSDGPPNPNDPDNDPAGNIPTTEVAIHLPQGSDLELNGNHLTSHFESYPVSTEGNSEAILNDGTTTLTILQAPDGKAILAGFIDRENPEISVRSTVVVNLYYSLGTVFLPLEVKERFLREVDGLPYFEALLADAEAKFKEDANYLFSQGFADRIAETLQEWEGQKNHVDIFAKIKTDGSDIRSGIQLREDSSFSFSLINNYRRRAHAFLYKDSIAYDDGTGTKLIPQYGGQDHTATKDTKVDSPIAIREVMGVIADYGGGAGLDFARTEAGPFDLPLDDQEDQVSYKCRVIGPSVGSAPRDRMTLSESRKLDRLIYETWGYELVLPLLLDVLGQTKATKPGDSKEDPKFIEEHFEGFVDQLSIIGSSISAIDQPLKNGDYYGAMEAFYHSYYNNALGGKAGDLITSLLDAVTAAGVKVSPDYFIQNSTKATEMASAMGKWLERTDIFLKLVDYTRVLYAMGNSEYLEQWEVTVNKGKVTLLPESALAVQGQEKDFKAYVEDGALAPGQSYEYHWSTTGTYGVIRDDLGKEGTSFTSSRDQISYFSSNTMELPEGAQDQIQVEVYLKQGQSLTKINEETAKVSVVPLGFRISPDGATVEGGGRINLKVLWTDGKDPVNSMTQDYRFVWDCTAQFGLFNGSQSGMTKTNEGTVYYHALEQEREGRETVSVSVYSKNKEESRYTYIDKVEAQIDIKNDPDCDIKTLALEPRFWNTPNDLACGQGTSGEIVVRIPKDENATGYRVQWNEVQSRMHNHFYNLGGFSWTNEDLNGAKVIDEGGVFVVHSGLGNGASCSDNYSDNARAFINDVKGFATVTICYD